MSPDDIPPEAPAPAAPAALADALRQCVEAGGGLADAVIGLMRAQNDLDLFYNLRAPIEDDVPSDGYYAERDRLKKVRSDRWLAAELAAGIHETALAAARAALAAQPQEPARGPSNGEIDALWRTACDRHETTREIVRAFASDVRAWRGSAQPEAEAQSHRDAAMQAEREESDRG